MQRYSSVVFVIVFLLGLSMATWGFYSPSNWVAIEALGTVFSGIIAAAGLLLITVQIRRQNDIARAEFVNTLATDVDRHASIESDLDREGKLYEEGSIIDMREMEAIEKYLTFFERVYFVIDANVVPLSVVDDLFAYRFFHLVHNPNVQKHILFHPDMHPHFLAVFKLHKVWLRYRKMRNAPIPRSDFAKQLVDGNGYYH